jgi:hypothetical protein
MAPDHIDFWFTMGSTYSYLSAMRLPEVERASGIRFRWRPFHLLVILQEMKHVPFADKPTKSAYMWRDIERRAAKYGIPAKVPAPYPAKASITANLVAVLGMREGWGVDFVRAAYRHWFVLGQETRQRAEPLGKPARDRPRSGSRAGRGGLGANAGSAGGRDRCRARTRHLRLAHIRSRPRTLLGRRPPRGRDQLAQKRPRGNGAKIKRACEAAAARTGRWVLLPPRAKRVAGRGQGWGANLFCESS